MKKTFKYFSFASLLFLQSCLATHTGIVNNSAALSQANFAYKSQNLSGSSTAHYVLGIGGMAKESLISEAKRDLMQKASLKENQTLANVTVSFKNSNYLGVYIVVNCLVTADVVEFK